MRRSLVLGDESAHHPFLQSLPPHVRGERIAARRDAAARHERLESPSLMLRAAYAAKGRLRRMPARLWAMRKHITAEDVRGFLLAYCACFLAVSAFIA